MSIPGTSTCRGQGPTCRGQRHICRGQRPLRLAAAVFMCLLGPSPATPSLPAWTSRLHGHSQHTADVTMTLSSSSLQNERKRRESGAIRDVLPLTLTFTFTVGQEEIKLSLRKNQFVSTAPPLFFIRRGKVVQEEAHKVKDDLDLAFYQDQVLGASVMATCSDGLHYQLVGSYFHRGQEYSIEPIYDRGSNDHDHRVYRLPAQSHLKHDAIPFMAGLYTRDMEELMPDVTAVNNDTYTRKFTDSRVSDVSCNMTDSVDSNVSCDSINNSTHLADSRPDTNLTGHDRVIGVWSPLTALSEVRPSPNLNHNISHSLSNDPKHDPSHSPDPNHDPSHSLDPNHGPSDSLEPSHSLDPNHGPSHSLDPKHDPSHSLDPNHDPSHSPDPSHDPNQAQKQKLTTDHADGWVRPGDRKKRQTDNYIVELAMVIDHSVYQVWHDGVTDLEGEMKRTEALRRITQFYSFILNGIDLRYSSVRRLADFHIDVTWAGIVITDSPVGEYWLGVESPPTSSRGRVESSLLLETFRTWAGNLGAQLPPSDHVMLFTGHNLTYGGSVSNAGLAYLGSACNLDFFFSIVEEYFDFRDVAIAAHELGHSLGARHDMDGNLCLAQDRYIMTSRFQFPSERKARNPWLFSRCSVQYFRDFIQELDRNETNCLVVQDSVQEKEILPYLLSLPGEVYPSDDFCRIGDGASSYICRDRHGSDFTNICYGGVFCYSPTERQCLARLPPDGFSCGNQKWCVNGTCQPSDLAPVTTGDDCPFRDRPHTAGTPTCADRVVTELSECYRDTFRAECCASCFQYRSSLSGCEYGDQLPMCVREQCLNYDLEFARDNCCSTCAQLLFTLSETMETTTAIFNLHNQPMGNSSKTTDVTSRAKDNSSDWRNHIASPEKSPRRESEERGRIWDRTAQNGRQRLWRGRGGSESQESAESDEDMPRDFARSPKGGLTSDGSESSRTATGEYAPDQRPSGVQERGGGIHRASTGHPPGNYIEGSQRILRNLLDNIRNSQQTVGRSQRMRLLTNFLDRIRRQNLGNI